MLLAGSAGLDATDHPLGYLAIAVFVLSYACVIFEEMLLIWKNQKPVMLAAGLIWIIVGMIVLSKTSNDEVDSVSSKNNIEQVVAAESSSSYTEENLENFEEISDQTSLKIDNSKTSREVAFHDYNVEIKHLLVEFSELFFFLFVAMTFILTMEERGI